MNLSLRQLRYAVATARSASVSLAAEELNVSQPSVTAAIDQIEAQLGQPIFVRRRGSGASLTPFGRSIIGQARRILEETRRLEHLALGAGAVSGELVLGCFDDLAPYCAPALIRRLGARLPMLRVSIEELGFEALRRRLADGTIDLALTYDLALDSDIETIMLQELRAHALLAADHPLAAADAVSLAELAAWPLILSDQAPSWQHILDLFRLHGLSPAVFARTRSFELQRSFVASGFGVALVYSQPCSDRSYDGAPLCRRPIRDMLPAQRIVLARHGRYAATAAGAALTDVALNWFAERPPGDPTAHFV